MNKTIVFAVCSLFAGTSLAPFSRLLAEEIIPLKPMVVPQDTRVPLRFTRPVSTATAKVGDTVHFETTEDVSIDGTLVVPKGSPAIGIVTDVRQPGALGRNAQLRISFQSVRAVDESLIPLSPYRATGPERYTPAAPVASMVGVIALGPIGLVSGAFIQGNHITIKEGATVDAAIARETALPTEQDIREVVVGSDTTVPLEFASPISTRTSSVGDIVDFVVRTDVYVNGILVVAKGTPATGSVKRVKRPRSAGRNGNIEIQLIGVKGADGTLLALHPYRAEKSKGVNPESVGVSVAGGIIFGPIGILAGAVVRGKHVDIPVGAKAVAALVKDQHVKGFLPAPTK